MKYDSTLTPFIQAFTFYDLSITLLLVTSCWLFQRFLLKSCIAFIVETFEKKHKQFAANTLNAFSFSIRYAFLTICVWTICSFVLQTSLFTYEYSARIFYALIIIWIYKGLADLLAHYTKHPNTIQLLGHKEITIMPFILRVCRALLAFLAVFLIAYLWGFNLNGFLTGIGLTSVALAFGIRDTSSHIFAGLSVGFDQPFQIGDWISTEDQKIEGSIVDFNLRSTVIETVDGSRIYVPNSFLLNRPLYNLSSRELRKVDFSLQLDRQNDEQRLLTFCDQLTEQIYLHLLSEKKLIAVHVDAMDATSYTVLVSFYVQTNDRILMQDVKQDILFAANMLINDLQIVLAIRNEEETRYNFYK